VTFDNEDFFSIFYISSLRLSIFFCYYIFCFTLFSETQCILSRSGIDIDKLREEKLKQERAKHEEEFKHQPEIIAQIEVPSQEVDKQRKVELDSR
jgi:hypothetical protein